MKIKEKQLYQIPYTATFDRIFNLNQIPSLLLDNMNVYTLNDSCIDRKIPFDIIVNTDNTEEKYILPRCNPEKYSSFLLVAKRIVECSIVQIKPEDYIDVTNYNGTYTFALNNKCIDEFKGENI